MTNSFTKPLPSSVASQSRLWPTGHLRQSRFYLLDWHDVSVQYLETRLSCIWTHGCLGPCVLLFIVLFCVMFIVCRVPGMCLDVEESKNTRDTVFHTQRIQDNDTPPHDIESHFLETHDRFSWHDFSGTWVALRCAFWCVCRRGHDGSADEQRTATQAKDG
jgi:hypothetical protein